ncbi:murein hydrolase activator EnvC family protein [Nocardioides gilvus]|uniref:murein hydrolase activator EnvC family protein n=1 Tax=Nocardioides gilvus TaxID=1735589 RepID=UPI000D74F850|nr:M23 family metallopeptidase [Nocardioides gilvus]
MRPFLTTVSISALLLGVLQAPAAVADTDPPPRDLTASGVWPLDPDPPVSRGFDLPGARWEAGHRGVDLLGRPAQSVRAPVAGTVSFAGRIAGRGVVTLSHGETRTTYEPVLSNLRVGTAVTAGEPIGWLHPTGSHCAPRTCLHWGWRRGSEYLDPMGLVGRTRIRLLPLWSAGSAGSTRQAVRPPLLPGAGTLAYGPGQHPWALFRPVGGPGRRPS